MLYQIQLVIEPFHRMFSLDNLSIQYPHAAVERVPVSKGFLPSRRRHQLISHHRLEHSLLHLSTLVYHRPLGHVTATWCT